MNRKSIWKKYTGFGAYPDDEVLPEPHLIISDAADRPGPLDNSNIVSTGSNSEGEDLQLLDNLEEERDYVLVSQDVWEKLFEWYKGGPVLPRKMISVGVRQELVVEVYPLCLKVIDARDRSVSTIRLSKKSSLHELHERVRSLKRTGTGKVRIWDYFNNRKQAILEDSTRSSRTLEKSDLQMNQSILVEVQVDEILLPTGFDMNVTWNEIKVCVNVWALTRSFFLGGFEPSDTVGIVKMRVNDLVFRTPITEKFLPLHPACGEMVSFEGNVFGDDETLTSLYKSCCSKGDKYITMDYIRAPDLKGTPKIQEHMHFLRLTQTARFIEEEIEESHEDKHTFLEDEDEDEDEHEDEDTVSIAKRPTTIHPVGLGIKGPYELFNSKNKIISLSSFKFAVSMKTTASVILLAPNSEIFTHLNFLNSKSEYLVLHVCWDLQSYFFLRTVRTSYPTIPIVAVTDLDPHHLDLLTFLDTPPYDVLMCYGWDLSEDSDDEYFVTRNDFVNIKWLGLCPNDFEGLHFNDDARPAPLPGFEEVIRMLRVNPYLRRKEDWLAALDWLDVYGKSVSFHLGGDFVSRKLSEKDWV
ncbi:hypothetical protein POM88_053822 [Heracleum sosnowskyi]|uniref:DUSP domain-containing protein n=1 Tax=Heracleum sosnowskyi TaxID=360622 RepID=A0AAD8GPW0_9APIA|nr:hypothetical protein POM88_053822 [Heracleum sosnowskyi]